MVAWCFGGVFRDRYRVFLSVVYREGVAVAYKCPGRISVRGVRWTLRSRQHYLVHLDIEYLCKNATRTLLNMKLDIGLEELEVIYKAREQDTPRTEKRRGQGSTQIKRD